MYPVDICWSVRSRKSSQLVEAGKITAAGWMHAKVTLSLVGPKHPGTGCIPLSLPYRKQRRGNTATAAEQSYQPNLSSLCFPQSFSQCVSGHVLFSIVSLHSRV